MPDDARMTVRALLAAAGIAPPEAEVLAMVQGYPALRAAADALYADAIARHTPAFLPIEESEATDGGDARDGAGESR